jgi:hypothetical protein
MDMFFYGVFVDPLALTNVVGLHDYKFEPATLLWFTRLGRSIIVADPNQKDYIEGFLARGVSEKHIEALDRFEGHPDLWTRTPKTVFDSNQKPVEACVYIPSKKVLKG